MGPPNSEDLTGHGGNSYYKWYSSRVLTDVGYSKWHSLKALHSSPSILKPVNFYKKYITNHVIVLATLIVLCIFQIEIF